MSNILQTEKPIQLHTLTGIRSAYEYLHRVSFNIKGMKYPLDLLAGDKVCIVGNSELTNMILTRLCVLCLLPRKHGGLGIYDSSSSIFILDAGNCTNVYQYVTFMKKGGLTIKKALQHIVISRLFTIYQLVNSIVYELPKIIQKYDVKVVAIPDLMQMFIDSPQSQSREIKRLLKEIENSLYNIKRNNILLITSLPSNSAISSNFLHLFNKRIEAVENKSNERFRLRILERPYIQIQNFVLLKENKALTISDLSDF